MIEVYFVAFALALFVSFVASFLVSRIAVRANILDQPDSERRFHKKPVPLLGGFAIFISFFLVVFFVGVLAGYLLEGNIPMKILFGIFSGGLILMIGGYLDDKYRLPAGISIIFPIVASLTLATSGISAVSIHNPFSGEIIILDKLLVFGLPVASGAIVFIWTMTMIYTTKLLDGMDGLVSGISAIASMILFGLSLTSDVNQPQTALLAIIFTGSLLGFLILNFHPAKIFLGEAGSTFTGFILAMLSIVSGGKIATALLVMGIPLLDALFVVAQRIFRKESPFHGDRKHLHFRLNEIGLSESQTVLLLYVLSAVFGVSALFLQSLGKLLALLIMAAFMGSIVTLVYVIHRVKRPNG